MPQIHEKGLLLCLGISPSEVGNGWEKQQEAARVAAARLGLILSSHV